MRAEPPKKVRIIGGTWRSRLLTVLDLPGLRPTTDRIRETLFNWLGQDLTGLRCLDLFAGTGALGFEAASRGADLVVLLEKDKKACANLVANFGLLQSSPALGKVEILQRDSLEFLKQQADRSSNLIFIDPPFADNVLFNRAVIEAGRICDDSGGGGIYVEFPTNRSREEVEVLLPDWHCGKYLEAGQVKACLFRGGRG
ncbi:16S rRNA (guanine(966)-N(2))-methyltransferase RsmD [Polynucleobacter wuianus]|uniref:16S rRNA (Guanine(966)-N(2))-methyltransferase RsmD n=1 Tax=Polynucleobacter wuianus TaxID=1743168 RepID=A0A191UHZ2_9BURK|nr:16S rRNA (guanine(966)-N(2))-methyltransferase RsmD [Polynucleobacter sp. MWH-Post4-6-1]ANJ00511.1 16S rRNA (guanine(966)-N(2))-methyltransferase RsmD [Polynucleobacter wuianus]MBU3553098.1 16S rRNA (guanine(966)-N(2))-methyltransferase RsmD [Polynucleobacter sp. MWH-Post4-6-1]MBU3609775.1 16S rRNA (guanine(966)-N(2))-methyltransferase RsmD [Polynucleobacter wuianus]